MRMRNLAYFVTAPKNNTTTLTMWALIIIKLKVGILPSILEVFPDIPKL